MIVTVNMSELDLTRAIEAYIANAHIGYEIDNVKFQPAQDDKGITATGSLKRIIKLSNR